MKKLFLFLAATAIAVSAAAANAFAATTNDVFLCMHNGSSMAYQSINGELLDYVEMKDSLGAVATARVIDSSTYLPFRYIAEMAGMTDAKGTSMQTNTFKYEAVGAGRLSIQTRKGLIKKNVNEPFEFVLDDGTKVEYKAINVDGSIYFPMRYMASLINGEAVYNSSTGDIYFVSNEKVKKEFLTDDNYIRYQKLTSMSYYEFDNTLGYSDIYLKSDGKTVSSVTEEMNNGHPYYSVTRARKTLYYVDENYKVWSKKEGESTSNKISFYTTKNEIIDPNVENIISYNNKLYGIELKDDSYGQVFVSDLDGENYKHIGTSDGAYNLILREYMGKGYIFYVDIDEPQMLHRINLELGLDESVMVTDTAGNNLLAPIDIVSVYDDTVVVSEMGGKIDIISLYGNIYEDYAIRGIMTDEITELNKSVSIEKVSSLNYDTDNDIVFFINNGKKGYGLYCYDVVNSRLQSIHTSQTVQRRISIIKMTDTIYRIYHYSDVVKNVYDYDLVSIGDDNGVKIGNNIVLAR